jgi:3-oxoacyl-[acyl-carrier-protein] synthase II
MTAPAARDRRVVVTGLGAVTAAGWGVSALHAALRAGSTSIGAFDRFDHTAQRTHVAGQVPPCPDHLRRRYPHWARLANSDRFALCATDEAIAHAALEVDNDRTGVFFGSSTAGLIETEQYFGELVRDAASRPRRTLLASHLVGAPAEAAARHLELTGPVETVSSACASGGLAIEQALRALRSGEVDVALAGGADCLCLTTYSGFNALRAVDANPCRPFRADRGGLSLGEGAAVLVLETLDHATARGAQPLAELLGAGSTCDAHHMTAPQAMGEWSGVALQRAIEDSAISAADIHFANVHGTGTPLNDAAESAALQRTFPGRTMPITATKGVVGHLLGAAGSVAAVATVLGLLDRAVFPTPGGGDPDPALPVDLVLSQPRSIPGMRAGVSASFGFGGANAAVVLGRWDAR